MKRLIKNLQDLNESLIWTNMKLWSHQDSIDEKLYKEEKEIVQVHYDKAWKMLSTANTIFLWSTALSISLYDKVNFLFWFFLIFAIIALFQSWFRNVRMNKCFNTLVKKLKQ